MNYFYYDLDDDGQINRPLTGHDSAVVPKISMRGKKWGRSALCIHYSLFTDRVRVKREGTKEKERMALEDQTRSSPNKGKLNH
jgi:hypothetical protein